MSRLYYDQPLRLPLEEPHLPGVQRNEVNDRPGLSPAADPTVPGTQPRGAPHLDAESPPDRNDPESKVAHQQQATSGNSRTESGTP
jgi:hypothetical protein